MINCPIYRAKKIDSDENIVSTTIGYFDGVLKMLINVDMKTWWFVKNAPQKAVWIEIDPSTLAVSFDGFTWFDMENAERAFREYSKTHGYERVTNDT